MGIVRLVIIAILIWFVWAMYRRFIQQKNTMASINREKQQKVSVKDVKRCAICGVHVLESDAIKNNNRFYCSKEHCDQDVT